MTVSTWLGTSHSQLSSLETQTRPKPSQYPTPSKLGQNLEVMCILRKWRKGPTVVPTSKAVDYEGPLSVCDSAFCTGKHEPRV